jgi:hypothetical protein
MNPIRLASGLAVFRGPVHYYSDIPPSLGCQQAVFSGGYIVDWVGCPDGRNSNDYFLHNCNGGQCSPDSGRPAHRRSAWAGSTWFCAARIHDHHTAT